MDKEELYKPYQEQGFLKKAWAKILEWAEPAESLAIFVGCLILLAWGWLHTEGKELMIYAEGSEPNGLTLGLPSWFGWVLVTVAWLAILPLLKRSISSFIKEAKQRKEKK